MDLELWAHDARRRVRRFCMAGDRDRDPIGSALFARLALLIPSDDGGDGDSPELALRMRQLRAGAELQLQLEGTAARLLRLARLVEAVVAAQDEARLARLPLAERARRVTADFSNELAESDDDDESDGESDEDDVVVAVVEGDGLDIVLGLGLEDQNHNEWTCLFPLCKTCRPRQHVCSPGLSRLCTHCGGFVPFDE